MEKESLSLRMCCCFMKGKSNEQDKGEQNAVNTLKTDWQPHPPPTAECHYVGFGYRLPMTAYLLSI